MKKALLLATLLTVATNLNAQTTKFGIKAGINVSNLTGDDSGDVKAKAGFAGGVYANIKFNEKFGFQPEVIYSQQGGKESGEIDMESAGGIGIVNADVTYKLDYINIPLMFKYYATPAFSIEAGPQIGFLVSAKTNIEANYLGQNIDTDTDVKDSFKSFDFGANLGVGYELSNGINFGVRYNFGISNIPDVDDVKVRNGVFNFSVGYSF